MSFVSIFQCPKCELKAPTHKWGYDPYEGECFCEECQETCRFVENRDALFMGIAAYQTEARYGGPEEGGWHYTHGYLMPETVRCYEKGDFPQLWLYQSLLHERHPHASVRIWYEELPPSFFPKQRPVYC